jgi:tryptophan-rich sensory protein
MENNQKEGKIRNRKFYLPSVFMFYTLKKEYLAPVLFVILLAIGGLLISIEGQGITYVILRFLLFFISDACFSVYLVAYIRELKGESYTVILVREAAARDKAAGAALLPYAVWTGFATALNASIWRRNR